jgi:hypothetical protein
MEAAEKAKLGLGKHLIGELDRKQASNSIIYKAILPTSY